MTYLFNNSKIRSKINIVVFVFYYPYFITSVLLYSGECTKRIDDFLWKHIE